MIQAPCRSIIVRTGCPAVAVSPGPRLKLVTRPRVGATICVWLRSNCAVSSAACAARSCGLSAPAGPSASSALRRSASAAATVASPEATSAIALSPSAAGVTPRATSSSVRSAWARLLVSTASASATRACAAATSAVDAPMDCPTCARSASAASTASRKGVGSISKSSVPASTISSSLTATCSSSPDTREEIGSTSPSTVPIEETGAVRSLAICNASRNSSAAATTIVQRRTGSRGALAFPPGGSWGSALSDISIRSISTVEGDDQAGRVTCQARGRSPGQ